MLITPDEYRERKNSLDADQKQLKRERAEAMQAARLNGSRLRQIGEIWGISRERVRQELEAYEGGAL